MGYFSNGSEGDAYEAAVCSKCVHQNGPDGESGCAVMLAHMLHNYKECNKPDSILHLLIPRGHPDNEGYWNGKCAMFHPRSDPNQLELSV